MKTNLYDPTNLLEAYRLTCESLPAEALNHRAWCNPSECHITPAGTPCGDTPAAIHKKTFTANNTGKEYRATITQRIEAGASEQENIHLEAKNNGDYETLALLDKCYSALNKTIPDGGRGALDPLEAVIEHVAWLARVERQRSEQ